jgi:hypothetical protein
MFLRRGRSVLCGVVGLSAFVLLCLAAQPASAALLKATYLFNNDLNAEEAGAPSLVPTNPLGLNQFETATVFGQTRPVFHYNGNASPPNQQAGLTLDTTGLIPGNNYSVEMIFEFVEDPGLWRRILETQNRTSDNGFYLEPGDRLQIWDFGALATGSTVFTTNVFHHVVLTTAPSGVVKAYLNGNLELTTAPTTVMNVSNADDLLHFFLDNNTGDEFADGRIALARIYDGVLTDSEVANLALNPFPAAVPEPGVLTLLGIGAVGMWVASRWRRKS